MLISLEVDGYPLISLNQPLLNANMNDRRASFSIQQANRIMLDVGESFFKHDCNAK